jgi:hypothetical protein
VVEPRWWGIVDLCLPRCGGINDRVRLVWPARRGQPLRRAGLFRSALALPSHAPLSRRAHRPSSSLLSYHDFGATWESICLCVAGTELSSPGRPSRIGFAAPSATKRACEGPTPGCRSGRARGAGADDLITTASSDVSERQPTRGGDDRGSSKGGTFGSTVEAPALSVEKEQARLAVFVEHGTAQVV